MRATVPLSRFITQSDPSSTSFVKLKAPSQRVLGTTKHLSQGLKWPSTDHPSFGHTSLSNLTLNATGAGLFDNFKHRTNSKVVQHC
jgi:hypothetical protein